jgi:hypothetical protein
MCPLCVPHHLGSHCVRHNNRSKMIVKSIQPTAKLAPAQHRRYRQGWYSRQFWGGSITASPPTTAHSEEQCTTGAGKRPCFVYWESAELATGSFSPARTVRLPACTDGQRSRPWRLPRFQQGQSIAPFPSPSGSAIASSSRLGVLARPARVSTPPPYLAQAGDSDSHSPYRRVNGSVWSYTALRGTRSWHSGSLRGLRLLERGAPRAGPYHDLRAGDGEIDAARVCGTLPTQARRSHSSIHGQHGGHVHGPSDDVTVSPPDGRASPVASFSRPVRHLSPDAPPAVCVKPLCRPPLAPTQSPGPTSPLNANTGSLVDGGDGARLWPILEGCRPSSAAAGISAVGTSQSGQRLILWPAADIPLGTSELVSGPARA